VVKFLHDTPADEDFFGPHSAIATAILDTVCLDHRLRIVGLSGSWGSGKSTVIRQLAKKLIADARFKDYVFFDYDAWLTQNDPPRRSFMEALIPFLIEKEVLAKDEWTRRLDILKGKIQETTKTTTPVLTWKSVALLKTYLLLAIGIFILNKLEVKTLFAGTATQFDKLTLGFAMGLIAIAPLAMVAIYIRERFIEKLAPSQRSVVPRLLKKSIDTDRETTTRLLEPTSIEFRDEFRDIMMQVGAKKYRLMIVLDNVDRLTDEEALSLWSTMRSFFVDRLGQDFSVTHAPIVIVPVDIGSLTRVFVKDCEAGQHGREIAQSYIDKTFDVVFDVREPTVSDWRSFFDDAFTRAVGDEFEPWDIHQARRIYEAHAVRNPRKTTPRAVIRLANAVASIVATSKDIPLPTIVLYVLNKTEIEEGISGWVTDQRRDFSEFDLEWKLNLAALYFMTDRNKAVGPLLKDDLTSAIIEETPEKISAFQDIQGLGDVISEIAHDPPVDGDGVRKLGSLGTIAAILREYGATIHGTPLWLEDARASLAKSFVRLDPSQPDLSKLVPTLEYLCSIQTDKTPLIRTAVTMVHLRLSATKLDSASLDIVSDAIDGLQRLAIENNVGTLEIPITGDTALGLIRQFAIYRRSKNWRCIQGPTEHSEIEEVLAKRLEDSVAQSSVPEILKMLSVSDDQRLVLSAEVEDHPLLVSIGEVIESGEKSQFVASAVEAMTVLLSDSPDLQSLVEGWSEDGQLTVRFNDAVNDGDSRRVWALITLGVASGTYFEVTKPEAWPDKVAARDGVARALASLSKRPAADRVELVWRAIREWKSLDSLLISLRNELIGRLDSDDLDAPALLKNYESTIIQAGRAPFLDFLVTNTKADEALNQLEPSALVQMVELPNAKPETKRKIVNALIARVNSASADEWSAWIQEGNRLFSHWSEIDAASARLGKRSGLAVALTRTASACIDDRIVLTRWRRASQLGNPAVIQDAKIALLGQLASQSNAAKAISVLKIFEVTDASIQAQGVGLADFLSRIIAHEDGRKWIDSHGSAIKRRVKAFRSSEAKGLREALDGLAKDKREGRRLWAQRAQGEWFGRK
jgi:hypothetical protein